MSSLSAGELLLYLVVLFGIPLVVLAVVSTIRNRSVGWIFLGLLSWVGAIAGVAVMLRQPKGPEPEAAAATPAPSPATAAADAREAPDETVPAAAAEASRRSKAPQPAAAPKPAAARKASSGWRAPLGKEERTAIIVFAACALVLAAVWFLGFVLSMGAKLWSVDVRIIQDPGMPLVFTDHIDSLMSSLLLIMTAYAAYIGCVWAASRGFRYAFQAVIAASTIASIALVPMMPLTSPDAVHLASDVRALWIHGRYPTTTDGIPQVVAEETGDKVAAQVRDYAASSSSYGPVSYIVGGLSLPFAGDELRGNLAGVKAVAGLFLVLTAVAAGLVAKDLGRNPAVPAALIGLNPLMLWEFPGNGHNDTIMAAFGVAALLFLIRTTWPQRAIGAGLGLASVAAKFGLAPAAPLVAAYWFPRYRLYMAAAALIIGGTAAALLVSGDLPGPVARQVAPAGVITRGLWREVWDWAGNGGDAYRVITGTAYGLFVLIAAYLTWRQPLVSRADLVAAIAILMFFFIFVGYAGYRPWYQVWYLPFVMIAGVRWLVASSIVFTFGAFLIVLGANWQADIANDIGLNDAIGKASIGTWIAVAATGFVIWWSDRQRTARTAAVEAGRGRGRPVPKRRPIRSR